MRIHEIIMNDYAQMRKTAQISQEQKKELVYKKLPILADIDAELAQTGIMLAKCALSGDTDQILRIKEKNEKLQAERKEILAKNKYSLKFFDTYKCNLCKDTGYVDILDTKKGSQSYGQYLGSEKCRCYKQKYIEKLYNISNVKNIIEIENFETFDLKYYSSEIDKKNGISPRENMQLILQLSLDFAKNFGKQQKTTNLFFYGQPGLGKTFLCNCIAKDVMDSGHTVLYLTAPNIFKIIENHRFNNGNVNIDQIQLMSEVDLLILDDLGSEFQTTVTLSELFNLINTRILNRKPMIISSNLAPQEIAENYSERINSRFIGSFQLLKIFGEDVRVLKKYGH